ncbi:cytochrome P450 [Aspergillus insuetus]
MGFNPTLISCLLIAVFVMLLKWTQREDKLPLINGKKRFDFGGHQVRMAFATRLPEMLQQGFNKGEVFRLLTPSGIKFVLAPKFAPEILTHPELIPGKFLMNEFNAYIPGFEVFGLTAQHEILQDTVRLRLTRQLNKLTRPLTAETAQLLKNKWPEDANWHEVCPSETAVHIISRLTSMVLVGETIGRDPEWLSTMTNYTTEAFHATYALNLWPRTLRRFIAYFDPSCRKLRHHIARARAILLPVKQARSAAREAEEKEEFDDAIQWLDEVAGEQSFDPTIAQMTLALASIHTTSDLLSQVLLDLCHREDWNNLVQDLRNEIVSALGGMGWQKIALNRLNLLDSVLKESQRMRPATLIGIAREATKTMRLSNGTVIPKGSMLFVTNTALRDPKIYHNPDTFDPYRFANLRAAGSKSAYLVSPSPEHLGFGLGKHACPGRFFAANELKIILCHMLIKYDLKAVDGSDIASENTGPVFNSNRAARIAVRRRQEEINL